MKIQKEIREKRWGAYTIATCSAVILYVALTHLPALLEGIRWIWSKIAPIIYAIIIAYILSPVANFFEEKVLKRMKRRNLAHQLSTIITLVLVVLLIAFILISAIPQVVNSALKLLGNMDGYIASAETTLNDWEVHLKDLGFDFTPIKESIIDSMQNLTKTIVEYVNVKSIVNTSYSVGMGLLTTSIICITAVYFLADRKRIVRYVKRIYHSFVSEQRYNNTLSFWKRCDRIMVRYIFSDLIDALLVGISNFIFMSICGMQYALIVSLIVGITNLAPTFGPIVGGALGLLILLLVNPWHALWFLVFTIIIQAIDGYIVKPKLFGGTLGVSAVWILLFLTIGSRMFGISGILLSIPCAAIADFILRDYIENQEKKRILRNADDSGKSEG